MNASAGNHHHHHNSKKKDDHSNSDKTTTTSTSTPRFMASSAATATTPQSASPSSSNSNNNNDTSSCRSCVDLLREILNRSESRPRSLLQSLFSESINNNNNIINNNNSNDGMLQWRDTQQGVQVLIPTEAASARRHIPIVPPHRRRWSRFESEKLQELENSSNTSINTIIEKDNTVDDNENDNVGHNNNGVMAARETVDNNNNNQTVVVLQATSATSSSTTSAAASPSSTKEPETEWLQVSCKKCSDTGPEAGARAYIMGPTPLSMVVCTNRLLAADDKHTKQQQQSSSSLLFSKTTASKLSAVSQQQQEQQQHRHRDEQLREMEEILTHELVHVYDVRKLQLDLRDCENLAYSEVRAAREAECQRLGAAAVSAAATATAGSSASSSSTGAGAGLWRPYNQHETCVRTKALTATHNLFPSHGQACLQRVFDKAMKDKRPFGK